MALGGIGGEVESNENNSSEGREDSLFVNEKAE
jgi:hypothetical protein